VNTSVALLWSVVALLLLGEKQGGLMVVLVFLCLWGALLSFLVVVWNKPSWRPRVKFLKQFKAIASGAIAGCVSVTCALMQYVVICADLPFHQMWTTVLSASLSFASVNISGFAGAFGMQELLVGMYSHFLRTEWHVGVAVALLVRISNIVSALPIVAYMLISGQGQINDV
jgi:hypothetical protein